MIRVYYVETKTYYTDQYKGDHQIADGGDLPILSTKKATAIDYAKRMEKMYVEKFGYKTTIPDSENPAKKGDCIYAVRQIKEDQRMRHELRVYIMYTI